MIKEFEFDLLDEKVEEIIKDNIKIKTLEKKKFGEVFTPYDLINKMLDSLDLDLDVDVDVFQNPNLKWLDPTAGIGNFMMVIYSRLMKGLKNWEPDLEKRKNHIIENMLFMIELNETNVQISRTYFGANANIVCEDFLTSNVFGKSKSFDIIIGNPPFQLNAGLGGKKKLYEQITLKCLNSNNAILNWGGKLLFLVPDNLFGGNSSKTYVELLKYNIEFIDFRSFWTNSFFKIQQKICCFLLSKQLNIKDKCKIYSDFIGSAFFSVDLKDRVANPIKHWTFEMDSLLDKYLNTSNKNNNSNKNKNSTSTSAVFYNRGKNMDCYLLDKDINKNKDLDLLVYELIYSSNKIIFTDDVSLAVGYGKKKIILFVISVDLEYFMDWTGCYGCGPNTIYITFDNKEEGEKLESFFNSDIYRDLMNACKTCRKYLKIGLIQHLII